jgi:hypothetical protein
MVMIGFIGDYKSVYVLTDCEAQKEPDIGRRLLGDLREPSLECTAH